MKYSKKFLKKIDLFTKNISLTLAKRRSFHSAEGGVLSLFVLGFIIAITIMYLSDLIDHNAPMYYFKHVEDIKTTEVDIDQTNFLVAIKVEGDNVPYYDNSYFEIKVNYKTYTIGKPEISVDLDYSKCSGRHINVWENNSYTPANDSYINLFDLSSYYCPNIGNSLKIGGNFSQVARYLSFDVSLCNNQTELKYNVTCKSPSDYTDKFYVAVKTASFNTDPDNFLTPVLRNFHYDYYSLDTKLKKILMKNMARGEFLTDNVFFGGGVYKTAQPFGNYLYEYSQILDFKLRDDSNSLFVMPIYLTKLKSTYKRTYMKLQDLAGMVAGFLQMVIFGVYILTHFLKNYEYKHFFFENLMDFKYKLEDDVKGEEFDENQNFYVEVPNQKAEIQDVNSLKKPSNVNSAEVQLSIMKKSLKLNEGDFEKKSIKKSVQFADNNVNNKYEEGEVVIENGRKHSSLNLDGTNRNLNELIQNSQRIPIEAEEIMVVNQNKDISAKDNEINDDPNKLDETIKTCSDVSDLSNKSNNFIQRRSLIDPVFLQKVKNHRSVAFLKDIVEFKKKKSTLKPCEINRWHLLYDNYCYFFDCCSYLRKETHQIIQLANRYYLEKLDLLNLIKHIDQMALLKKILLNKSQNFMLDNKDKKLIYNEYKNYENVEEDLTKDFNSNIENLKCYLKNRKNTQNLDSNDLLLFENLSIDIKKEIIKEVEM